MFENEIVSELGKMKGKSIDVLLEGVVNSKITFEKLSFDILCNILNLHDNKNNYFALNTNQIVNLIIDKSIKIITDNDILISIKEIKNAY